MSSTALAKKEKKRTYSPLEAMMANAHRTIKSILQDEKKANRFTAMALQIAKSKELRECTDESKIEALIGVAMLGLNPDKNIGQAYVIAYRNNKTKTKEAQLQIGYKGYIVILNRAGFSIKAYAVYDVDEFKIVMDENGWDEKIIFKPNYEKRNEGDPVWEIEHLKYIYAIAKDKKTGELYRLILNKQQIEKIRRLSTSQRLYDEKTKKYLGVSEEPIGIWADFYIDMAKKTAVKKLAKSLPLDDFTMQVVSMDDLSESGKSIKYKESLENGVIVESEAIEDEIQNSETVDPLELAAPKTGEEIAAAEVVNKPVKVTVDTFKELYKSLPKEKKSEFLGYTQGVDLEALNEEELSNFYNEVKAYVGA